jgi:hypothetical protein
LRRFRPFEHGVPAHDHLGDILAALDPEAFRGCFIAWVSDQIGVPPSAIAIDGKAVRCSYQKSGGEEPIHIVSAFATAERLVLGQVKVDAKSNEITAIPKLVDLLDIKGSVVSIDAMGCQRAIAQKIKDKGADYLLALKGKSFPLGLVLRACPQIVDYGPGGSVAAWRDLMSAAVVVRSMLGVSPSAYETACAVMGPENAATVMACILERGGHINSAGGYLRDLTRRVERGEFALGPMLMAQLRGNGVPTRHVS